MTNLQGGFPTIDAPAVEANGRFTQPWYQFFINLWNRTGSAAGTTSAILDNIGNARGDVLYRGATQWLALAPGAAGNYLSTNGAGADPSWIAGTLPVIANNRLLANTSGGAAAPVATTVTATLDILGAVQGEIIYRNAAVWGVLAPGASGQFLQTLGAAANPAWAWPESVTTAITAAGATQATATALTTTVNEVTTTALATGVRMFTLSAGQRVFVINQGANPLSVYPNGVAAIDALGASNAYTLAAGKSQLFWCVSAVQIYSTQLG